MSPKLVKWILYNVTSLKKGLAVDSIICSIPVERPNTQRNGTCVQWMEIKSEIAREIIDAVERAIKVMHPEQRNLYRLRYRKGYSYKEIIKKMSKTEKTVERRLTEINKLIGHYLQEVPEEHLNVFCRKIEG